MSPHRANQDASTLESKSQPKKKRTLKGDIARVVFIVALFTIAMISLKHPLVEQYLFDTETLRQRIQNEDTLLGMLQSYAGFLVLMSLLIGIGLPRLFVSTLAGTIYGAFVGTALALGSSLLGSIITYMLGQSVLRGVAKRRLSNHFTLWDKRLKENAFWWVLVARLAPFINGQMMNLLFGALRCPMKPFLLASVIGFLPLTLVFALLGSAAAKGSTLQLLIGGVLLLIVNIVYFMRRRKRRSE
jgi:uncharacterized membrane protein YdjX (TVP38/TMEM64 family)